MPHASGHANHDSNSEVLVAMQSPVLCLSYRCRECSVNFGDPDGERDFGDWELRVTVHALDVHNKRPYYLNDMLKPIWSLVSIR